MRRWLTVLTVLALCAAGKSAWAQEAQEQERDVLEVGLSGGFGLPMGGVKSWHDSLGAKTGVSGSAEVGFFLNPDMVLGFNFTYYRFGIDTPPSGDSQHHRVFSPNIYLKHYFFGSSKWVPYLRGQAGIDYVKFSTVVTDGPRTKYREISYDRSFAFGLGGGVFMYTSDYGGFFLEADYHHAVTKNAERLYNGVTYKYGENVDVIQVKVGINVYFGPGQ